MFTPSSGPGRPPQSSQPSDWPAGTTPPEAPQPQRTESDNIAVAIPTRTIRRVGIGVGVVVVVALLVLAFFNRGMISSKLGGGLAGQIDSKSYQAVFLVGSQVYFGHLSQSGSVYLLSDIYYIADQGAAAGDSSGPRGQLVKRGSEIHGPRDPMVIPASQVLFVENMRDDSDVVRAITASKASGGVPAPNNAAPSATQPAATATPARTATPGATGTPAPGGTPIATPTAPR